MRTASTIAIVVILAMASIPAEGTPADPDFEETIAASGFDAPDAIAFLPDGRMLVAELGGNLWVVEDGSATFLAAIPVAPNCGGFETGLLGMAVDPHFETNGFVYLYRTDNHDNVCSRPLNGWNNEVIRVTIGQGDTVDLDSLTVLLPDIPCVYGCHVGGGLRLGPDDTLYAGVGDNCDGDGTNGPGASTNIYAQDLDSLSGKVLRLNLDGSVPSDNPFVNQVGKRGEIWAYGFRNPFRFGFDPKTKKLWLGDVGQDDVEEVDIILKGKNYSWPHCEGNLPAGCRRPGEAAPVFTYRHVSDPDSSRAITGGGFAGPLFGELSGHYFYGDYRKSRIYRLTPNPTRNGVTGDASTFVTDAGRPVDLVFGPDGGLYYVSLARGDVRRVGPSSGGDQPLAGKRLLLKQSPVKGLQVLGKDAVALGLNLLDDPTLAGGTLQVSGTGFDDVYDLPASHWTAIGKPGAIRGFKYTDPRAADGPISLVQVLNGKLIKAIGRGDELGHTVGSMDPSPVDIVLTVGTRRYCMDFGGTPKLVADKKFTAVDSEAPAGCPARRTGRTAARP